MRLLCGVHWIHGELVEVWAMKMTISRRCRVRFALSWVSAAALGWVLANGRPLGAAFTPVPGATLATALEAPACADEPGQGDDKKAGGKKAGGSDPADPDDPADEPGTKTDPGSGDGEAQGKTVVKKVDKDEQFVKEHFKELLSPSTYKELEDGRTEIGFDLSKKDEAHRDIFSLNIGNDMKDVFRWSIDQEEFVVGGGSGLRLSNKGVAFLHAWFTDEVEAEMEFNQYINFEQKHVAAMVFSNGKGSLLASNYGSECMTMQGAAIRSRLGKPQAVLFDKPAKIKLVVKDGEFSALRDGKVKNKAKYSRKTFASGQVGILWGGSISAIVTNFTVTGKIDYKKTAAELRKYQGKVPSGR